MNRDDLERCLTGKLRLKALRGDQYTDYRLDMGGGVICLPALLRLSDGSEDVDEVSLTRAANALGLSRQALETATRCRISRACVLLCLATRLLEIAMQKWEEQGDIYRPAVVAMIHSVELLVTEVELSEISPWNHEEKEAMQGARGYLRKVAADREVGDVASRVAARINLP